MRFEYALTQLTCKKYTSTSTLVSASNLQTLQIQNGTTPQFPPVSNGFYFGWNEVATDNLVASSYTNDKFYTMLDSGYVHCRKPLSVTPDMITYAYPAEWGSTKNVVLDLKSCDGRSV